LVESGVRPLALSRRPPEIDGVDGLQADLHEAGLAARLPKLSTVYSLAPIWLLPDALPAMIGAGANRVVAFSSTSRFTKIESPIQAEREVAGRLAESEARTIALCAGAGTSWTILRPTLIYAEGLDGNISRLARLIRRLGFLPLAGLGEGLRQPVHADDLAAAAIAANAAPDAQDRAYDLPGGETLTYRAMTERVFEGMDRTPRIMAIPAPIWSLAFNLASPFLPGATTAMGARMSEDLIFDVEPARRDLRWEPRTFHPNFSLKQPSPKVMAQQNVVEEIQEFSPTTDLDILTQRIEAGAQPHFDNSEAQFRDFVLERLRILEDAVGEISHGGLGHNGPPKAATETEMLIPEKIQEVVFNIENIRIEFASSRPNVLAVAQSGQNLKSIGTWLAGKIDAAAEEAFKLGGKTATIIVGGLAINLAGGHHDLLKLLAEAARIIAAWLSKVIS
jgi:uncharacterized protein YbjT (DUF2867 family)